MAKTAAAFFLSLLLIASVVRGQDKPQGAVLKRTCATEEVLKEMLAKNPALAAQWRKEGQRLQKDFLARASAGQNARLSFAGTIVIPVVVHIITDNPSALSDRDVLDQIEKMNTDFAGANIDTAVIPPEFRSRVGHTTIRFTLARTDPNGVYTNGIERKTTSSTFTQTTYANVKHASSGGLDAWDVSKYYNIWVARFTDGLLGIATFPFMTPANEQGVVINNRSFGLNPCYVYASFNQGRTVVHETGHYFYLFHIWGDDDGACSGTDFKTQTGFSLPASCGDDTPNQADQSSGFLGGYVTDSCSPARPGFMYQSYMDYTDDVSYGMFSAGQACRMQNTLDLYRSSLKTSTAGSSPIAVNDAYLLSVTPGDRLCANTPVIVNGVGLRARVRNSGSAAITNLTFRISYDGGAASTVNWTGSLEANGDTTIPLGNVSLTSGVHVMTVYTMLPNGLPDIYTANDTLVRRFIVAAQTQAAPLSESFESTSTFPSAGWNISNPDGNSYTWSHFTGVGHTGNGAAVIVNYRDTAAGMWDDLILPPLDFGSSDSSVLSFWHAYRPYSNRTDGLRIWLSNDSGRTFIPIYSKSAPELQTVSGGGTTVEYKPAAADWVQETINLTPYLIPGRTMTIFFRNINGFANDLYLDDISVSKANLTRNDVSVTSIRNLPDFICSGNTFNPSAVVRNAGTSPVTGFTVNYQVDSTGTIASQAYTGTVAAKDSVIIALPAVSATSVQHTFIVYTSLPGGLPDDQPANDTAKKVFTVSPTVTTLREGFENAVFPPAGWGTSNPDNGITWSPVQKATSVSAGDAQATWIHGFAYSGNYNTDDLRPPVFSYSGVDSVFLSFDYAGVYTLPLATLTPVDTFEILITPDCGATMTSVYKRFGPSLSTATVAPGTEFFPSGAAAYRRDSVDLTSFVPATGSFQAIFRYHSNNQNNFFLDNVNVRTRTLPATLKTQGYLIYPNPAQSYVLVQHYKPPTDLRAVQILGANGQVLQSLVYNGGAGTVITVNMARYPAGVYFVRLIYTNRQLTERVIHFLR